MTICWPADIYCDSCGTKGPGFAEWNPQTKEVEVSHGTMRSGWTIEEGGNVRCWSCHDSDRELMERE